MKTDIGKLLDLYQTKPILKYNFLGLLKVCFNTNFAFYFKSEFA